MAYRNRIRLPFFLSRPQFPMERNVFRKADGSSQLLSAVIRNTYQGKTDHLPEDWHRKLVIALAHDDVTIEDNRFLSDVVIDGDYNIDWQEFLNNPLAPAGFTIQVTPFDATNSNCQTCEEIAQLELVDDSTDEVWDENETYEFPDPITANDTICCFPFEIEIVSFNTLYFLSVTVDQDGILTATTKFENPIVDNVWIATYRVTCENGGYDEADVYGNITGTSTECLPPSSLTVDYDPDDTPTEFTFSWVPPPGAAPANGYDYNLYLAYPLTNLYTGNTTDNTISFTGIDIVLGVNYIFQVNSNCFGSTSDYVTLNFETHSRTPNTCGRFLVTYLPDVSSGLQSFSYMDCNGEIVNYQFSGAGQTQVCMLVTADTETPIFFSGSSADITINYIEIC